MTHDKVLDREEHNKAFRKIKDEKSLNYYSYNFRKFSTTKRWQRWRSSMCVVIWNSFKAHEEKILTYNIYVYNMHIT